MQKQFEEAGQGHVFKFRDSLSEQEKKELDASLEIINLDTLSRMIKTLKGEDAPKNVIEPFVSVSDVQKTPEEERKTWYDRGLEAIANGEVALMLLGGGQGTRLGFNKPKGLFVLDLPSKKSLLQMQVERLIRLRTLAMERFNKDDVPYIPFYIMTSEFTHEETVSFFKESNFFGIPESSVFFFSQSTLPCLTAEGKIIMKSKSEVATAPNGNGGLYDGNGSHGLLKTFRGRDRGIRVLGSIKWAYGYYNQGLVSAGALDDMVKKGVKSVHVYCVDNALVKVCDPTFVGFGLVKGADCANKVVLKDKPHEKVGVMCLRDGSPSVIEYSEITKEMAEAVNESGTLVYGAGNIANHLFTVEFLQKCVTKDLPLHVAHKKIPYIGDNGEQVQPDQPNGYKMEMFVFDVFAWASNMHCLAVPRTGEFTALKNAVAPGVKDTPVTVRDDVSEYHISLVEQNGGIVERSDDPSAVLEISPLVSYEGEGLESIVKGKTFKLPCEIKSE